MVANRDYLRSRPQYIPTDPYPSRGPSGPTPSYRRKGTSHASARKGGVLSYGLGALGVVCVVALCYFLILGGRGKPNTVIKAKVDDFEIYLHHYESKAEPVLVYFVAGASPRNKKESWCPDCNLVTPVFYQMLERIGGHVIIEVDVGGPGQWKDRKHPLRHHEQFKLRSVPTLARWEQGVGVVSKIDKSLELSSTPKDVQYYVRTFMETKR
ncbi:DUF953 domain-containing protein [Chloropicon roscoffensis]|uniref:DUF953 domain-containing protein n=1 Tax=Chloropicon roscoffensis TaxID=1461544 RepID=A0AAX4PG70_9CHLO